MAALLVCENLRHTFGLRTLFEGIDLVVNDRERVGLIGPNGAGKSTLLRIFAGQITPSEGSRSIRKNARVAYLSQEPDFPQGATVRSALIHAHQAESIDEHLVHARAERQMSLLQFADPDQPVQALSGGWRKRLAMACLLALEPDMLVLDEPTNHLDLDGIRWLESCITAGTSTFLLVSHDRYLLENTCDRIVELNPIYPRGSFGVDGNYSRFLEKRAEFLDGQSKQQQSLANKVRREVEWLKRGPKARTTKAKFRVDEAGRMQAELADLADRNAQAKRVELDFTASQRRANKLLSLEDVEITRGGRTLFSSLSFHLEPGQKLGLLGANGSGKSTLLKLMTRQIQPDRGAVKLATGVRIALFDQNRDQLDQDETLRQAFKATDDHVEFQGRRMHVAAWAQRFLFRREQLDLPVAQLSGGEQARVLIARLMLVPADVLMLDEPTNDLDIPSLEVLEASLIDFPGAVVLVTHDRYLLERVTTSLLGLDGQGGFGFYPTFEHWIEARQKSQSAAKQSQLDRDTQSKQKAATPTPKRSKGLSYKEKKELETIESDIESAESVLEQLQREIADPQIVADHVLLQEKCKAMDHAQAKVQSLYARWADLEARNQD